MTTDAFPDKRFSSDCYTHDVGLLVGLAGLKPAWDAATATDPGLLSNWGIAKDWSKQKRYHRVPEAEARSLNAAVSDTAQGVLPWIKTHW